ncbi:hypothetical protein DH2020_030084 [Rehmannia glutinosa]|uniref:Vacuolar protein sorting-associated protein n=1 Tax=Rehmannia glutinosa TaxID=99300 RepID=A0ABR0VLS9_REHGL
MSQIPNLEHAPINLTAIRARAQAELGTILKNLILVAHLNTKHGAELRHLTAEPIQTERTKVVYLVRAQLELMKFICSHIHNDTSKGLHREYYLYFVPRRVVACEKILEEEKVHELLNIGEFHLYMIPMDEDILSFELDLAQKEYLVDGDATSLWHIAKGIHNLEFSFGVIPNVRAKGKAATRVADILNRMQAEEPVNNSSDRRHGRVRLLNCLWAVLGGHGHSNVFAVDIRGIARRGSMQFLGVNNGAVELDASIMGAQQEGKKMKVPLNSSDKLFKEIRDLNFEIVVQVLRQKATSMKQDYTDISTTSQTVSELKDFVKKLNSLPEMTRHINLAQHLSTFTSKPSFLGKLDMEQTLLEAQSYDMRELLHSYGFEHIATLNNLEKAGLFRKQDSKSNWLTIKRALQLLVEDTDTTKWRELKWPLVLYLAWSYYYGEGILVDIGIQDSVAKRPIEEILRLLPGPHSETKRGGFSSIPSYDTLPGSLNSLEKPADGRRALVLVVFIGGVTFAEISALRFLSSQEGMAYDLIVGTTKIVNGQTLVETFVDRLG